MTLENQNSFSSPLYSDGDLLVYAQLLKQELEELNARGESLKNSTSCWQDLQKVVERIENVAERLKKVIEALEGNGYDCSGMFS